MSWFRKKPPSDGSLLKAFEERLEHLERQMRSLSLEWENTWDKLQRIMGRLNARAKEQLLREPEEVDREPQPAGDFDRLAAMRKVRMKKHGLL